MDTDKEILDIKERNNRVESDKAWETSKTRKLVIFVLTYMVAAVWLYLIKDPNFFLNAFVPCLGWLLSTLTLPFIKRWWIEKNK
jgi:hypothetical protein